MKKIFKVPSAIKNRISIINELIVKAISSDAIVTSDFGSTVDTSIIFTKPIEIKGSFVYVEYKNIYRDKIEKNKYNLKDDFQVYEMRSELNYLIKALKKDLDSTVEFKTGGVVPDRIVKMINQWEKEGVVSTNEKIDNSDFFRKTGWKIDSVGKIEDFDAWDGNNTTYYNPEWYDNDNDAINRNRSKIIDPVYVLKVKNPFTNNVITVNCFNKQERDDVIFDMKQEGLFELVSEDKMSFSDWKKRDKTVFETGGIVPLSDEDKEKVTKLQRLIDSDNPMVTAEYKEIARTKLAELLKSTKEVVVKPTRVPKEPKQVVDNVKSNDVNISLLATRTGTRKERVEEFAKENNLSHDELLAINTGLGRKLIATADFVTAITGTKGNAFEKDILDFARSDKAFKSPAKRKYKLGDTYSSDFDYKGMLGTALKLSSASNPSLPSLVKLKESLVDVNYHAGVKKLTEAIELLEKGDKELAIVSLNSFSKEMSGIVDEHTEKSTPTTSDSKEVASLTPTEKEITDIMLLKGLSHEKATKLYEIRLEAIELKNKSFDQMLKKLTSSEFYSKSDLSKSDIDHVSFKPVSSDFRKRNLKKDARISAITDGDEINSTGKKFKRRSPTFGEPDGAKKPFYYEYRANRRDKDEKIRLATGGLLDSAVLQAEYDKYLDSVSNSESFLSFEEWKKELAGLVIDHHTKENYHKMIKLKNSIHNELGLNDEGENAHDSTHSKEVFALGGVIGNAITFKQYGDERMGVISDIMKNGYAVETKNSSVYVEPSEVLSIEPLTKKTKFLGIFKLGGKIAESLKESEFLDDIQSANDKVWDEMKIESAREIRLSESKQKKYAKLLESYLLPLKIKGTLNKLDFNYFRSLNDHLLNEFLVWNGYYNSKFEKLKKDDYQKGKDMLPEYALDSYVNPEWIMVKDEVTPELSTAERLLSKLKEDGKLNRYYDSRGTGIKYFETIVPNETKKGFWKRYESTSKGDIGTLQNEFLDENDLIHWFGKSSVKAPVEKKDNANYLLNSEIDFITVKQDGKEAKITGDKLLNGVYNIVETKKPPVKEIDDNYFSLKGKAINIYFMGNKIPETQSIISATVSPEQFTQRIVTITTKDNSISEFPINKTNDFMNGKEIEIKNGKEVYVISLNNESETLTIWNGKDKVKIGDFVSVEFIPTKIAVVTGFEGSGFVLKSRFTENNVLDFHEFDNIKKTDLKPLRYSIIPKHILDAYKDVLNHKSAKTSIEVNEENEVYVDFLNKEKNFKKDRKEFKTYEEAVKWCKSEFEKFDQDMIKFFENGGVTGSSKGVLSDDHTYIRNSDVVSVTMKDGSVEHPANGYWVKNSETKNKLEGYTDLSKYKPSDFTFERIDNKLARAPESLLIKANGKLIGSFYYNMRGFNPSFYLSNKEGVSTHFGEKSEVFQKTFFKKMLKEGFTFFKDFKDLK